MKRILLSLSLFLFVIPLFAQALQGQIINAKREAIAGAQILNLSNGFHTHSDQQGKFVLQQVSLEDQLEFSHLGYEIRKVFIDTLSEVLTIVLEEKSISLREVVIMPQVDALNVITEIDIETNPVNSSQDILRQVPGLFIGQHAGGGKAEQIFLRGFDVDHGTDIAITVDGMPVNMVSHAHGQGYADLHFVIPETVDRIDFGKGPYFAEQGNFNTAGYINFKTKRNVTNSALKLETGQFGTQRMLGTLKLLDNEKHQSYFVTEYLRTDGPFESPQNFDRINLFGKYTGTINASDNIAVTLSHFKSSWDASGQIPQRKVDDGSIGRFGAIDDTEGGETSRTNFSLDYVKALQNRAFLKSTVFYSKYAFELYSNFTFFLEDPINGDQIRQKENREIFGLRSEYNQSFSTATFDGNWQVGGQIRNDQIKDNELSHTRNRKETLTEIQKGDINETNFSTFLNANFNFGKWTINPGLRFDYFDFQYQDALAVKYQTQSTQATIFSPKLNILYNYSTAVQFYAKGGKGFHANDTRVVVAQQGQKTLPAAYGYDLGLLWKPSPQLLVNAAYWFLYLEQEFVYVGDAGIVEPSGQTQRQGLDLSLRYQPMKWLFLNLDGNYAYARSTEAPSGEDRIPLAPDFTMVAGLNMIHSSGLYGGLHARYLKDRAANEDNSIVAEGYTVFDFNVGYSWRRVNFSIQVQNLFDVAWNETQFATNSRLQNEAEPVEEIHFTPGTPFFLKGVVEYRF